MDKNNLNLDPNTMNNIKNMVENGNIEGAISQISPEMLQNFSQMMSNQNQTSNHFQSSNQMQQTNFQSQNTSNTNQKEELIKAIKPFMKKGKQEEIEKYMNMLNIAKIMKNMK